MQNLAHVHVATVHCCSDACVVTYMCSSTCWSFSYEICFISYSLRLTPPGRCTISLVIMHVYRVVAKAFLTRVTCNTSLMWPDPILQEREGIWYIFYCSWTVHDKPLSLGCWYHIFNKKLRSVKPWALAFVSLLKIIVQPWQVNEFLCNKSGCKVG